MKILPSLFITLLLSLAWKDVVGVPEHEKQLFTGTLESKPFTVDEFAAGAPGCEKLLFNWTLDSKPYAVAEYLDSEPPFDVAGGCEPQQHCLFMDDVAISNVIFSGASSVFPTSQNIFLDQDTSVSTIIENSKIVYDKHSVVFVNGLGFFAGPEEIGEYRVTPQFFGDSGVLKVSNAVALPQLSTMRATFVSLETLKESAGNIDNHSMNVTRSLDYNYYPCSVIRQREEHEVPLAMAAALSGSGEVQGTVEATCEIIMQHCTDELRQYDSMEDCIEYLSGLPHHDPGCQEEFGDYTTLGNSFMCKYLHHFLIPFAPKVHCAHVGKGLPDTNGKTKCAASDCLRVETNQESEKSSCDEHDLEEVVQGMLYTLPFCLPSLAVQTCSSNCTQAINTYLGRYAESGVLQACQKSIPGTSLLLDSVNIDVPTLLNLCAGSDILGQGYWDVVASVGDGFPECKLPYQYLGYGSKCHNWDWGIIAAKMFNEWSKPQPSSRITRSDNVATAECLVFSELYALYLNVEMHRIPVYAASVTGRSIQIHPNGSKLMTSHQDVSDAMYSFQSRDGLAGVSSDFCQKPGDASSWMQDPAFNPTVQNTASVSHRTTRQFISLALPGLGKNMILPPTSRADVFDDEGILNTNELLLAISEECFISLVQDDNGLLGSKANWYEAFSDHVRDAVLPAQTWSKSETWHRSQGYLLGTAYLSKRHSIARALKDAIPLSEMEIKLSEANLTVSKTDLAYVSMTDFAIAFPVALVKLTSRIILFIRQDPCRLIPLWNKSPERFIIEYARLNAPVHGFATAATGTSHATRYEIASANMDPNVFHMPLEFNPGRDLSQVLAWNFLEAEGPGSHARSCPARSFSVKFVAAYAPLYFPIDVKCANSLKIYNGVEFYEDSERIGNGFSRMLKTSSGSNNLFLFLNGFQDIPQEFAPVISHLQGKRGIDADFWSLSLLDLPGNVDGHASCDISKLADVVSNFVRDIKDDYKNVYIVGHDFGGMVGWHVASTLGSEVLSGLITFAPNPLVFDAALRKTPSAKDVHFYNLMGPLIGSTFLANNDFEILDDLYADEPWWRDYRDDYHQSWNALGAHKLTCSYRDNFVVTDNGRMGLANPEEINTDVNLLLIAPTHSNRFSPLMFEQTLAHFQLSRNQMIQFRTVQDATHHGVLHEDSAQIVADLMEAFMTTVQRKHFSMQTLVKSSLVLYAAPATRSDKHEDDAVIATIFLWILGIVAGISLELYFGDTARRNEKLITGIHVFTCITGFASQSYIGYIISIGSTFRFGVPDITSSIRKGLWGDSRKICWISLSEGISTAVHHFGGAISLASSPTGLIDPVSVLFIVMPLSFQHLTVLLDYEVPVVVMNAILEVWFQLEFYAIQGMIHPVPRVGIFGVLIAHYMMMTTYGCKTLIRLTKKEERKPADSIDATESSCTTRDANARVTIYDEEEAETEPMFKDETGHEHSE